MDNLDALCERLRRGPIEACEQDGIADAIRELRAELAQAVQTVRELGAVQATINAERDALRSANEQLARDAERYRWIRDEGVILGFDHGTGVEVMTYTEELDRVADADLAARGGASSPEASADHEAGNEPEVKEYP
jgi:hypothetical protein